MLLTLRVTQVLNASYAVVAISGLTSLNNIMQPPNAMLSYFESHTMAWLWSFKYFNIVEDGFTELAPVLDKKAKLTWNKVQPFNKQYFFFCNFLKIWSI